MIRSSRAALAEGGGAKAINLADGTGTGIALANHQWCEQATAAGS
jgi:hypothetical protein